MKLLTKLFLLLWVVVAQAEPMSLEDRVRGLNAKVIDDHYGSSYALSTDDLFIAAGSTIIRPEMYPTLNAVAGVLKDYCTIKVTVSGHTDNIFTKSQRMEISEKYAKSIADYLVQRGVDPQQIIAVKGYGSMFPIAINNSYQNRQQNRRVEVTLHAYDLP